MSTTTDKRYVNFPVKLLASTINDPARGLHNIASFALVEYAGHCPPEDTLAALVQLAYVATQRPSEHLPEDMAAIVEHHELDCVTDAWCNADGDGAAFVENARDILGGVKLSARETSALANWYALSTAASYFNRRISDHQAIRKTHRRIRQELDKHEAEHGPLAWCSVPARFFYEVHDEGRDVNLFRMVGAVRSIVGRHEVVGTTRHLIWARMLGAKTQAIAGRMAAEDEAIATERARGTRKRFDLLMKKAIKRGFVAKKADPGFQRMYLSTTLPDAAAIAEWWSKKRRRP